MLSHFVTRFILTKIREPGVCLLLLRCLILPSVVFFFLKLRPFVPPCCSVFSRLASTSFGLFEQGETTP